MGCRESQMEDRGTQGVRNPGLWDGAAEANFLGVHSAVEEKREKREAERGRGEGQEKERKREGKRKEEMR